MSKIIFVRKRGRWPSIAEMRRQIISGLNKSLNELGNEHTRLRREFVATWKGKPKFAQVVKASGTVVKLEVQISGAELNRKKYHWITKGTEIRYATMTHDFLPKTRVGGLQSGMGSGGLAYVSRRNPRPGIQARETDDIIRYVLDEDELRLIKRGIGEGLKKKW